MQIIVSIADSFVVQSNNEWVEDIKKAAINWHQGNLSDVNFIDIMLKSTQAYTNKNKNCFHNTDHRVLSALEILEKNSTSVLPLETIASQVFLSTSRFITFSRKKQALAIEEYSCGSS